jgi:hypothetical protein
MMGGGGVDCDSEIVTASNKAVLDDGIDGCVKVTDRVYRVTDIDRLD